jgi:hypothetical protein
MKPSEEQNKEKIYSIYLYMLEHTKLWMVKKEIVRLF